MGEKLAEVAELKRYIRGVLNMSAAHGKIDGIDAFAILQTVAAEFVAQVKCDLHRESYIDAVENTFRACVERELLQTEGMSRQ